MNPKLKNLYQDLILKHNREPYHFDRIEGASVVIEANNPLCGDRFQLYLEINGEDLQSLHFHGFGCAISKAATSILCQKLEGKTLQEAQAICQAFLQYVDGTNRAVKDTEVEVFAAVDEFSERKDCVVLSWKKVEDYLAKT